MDDAAPEVLYQTNHATHSKAGTMERNTTIVHGITDFIVWCPVTDEDFKNTETPVKALFMKRKKSFLKIVLFEVYQRSTTGKKSTARVMLELQGENTVFNGKPDRPNVGPPSLEKCKELTKDFGLLGGDAAHGAARRCAMDSNSTQNLCETRSSEEFGNKTYPSKPIVGVANWHLGNWAFVRWIPPPPRNALHAKAAWIVGKDGKNAPNQASEEIRSSDILEPNQTKDVSLETAWAIYFAVFWDGYKYGEISSETAEGYQGLMPLYYAFLIEHVAEKDSWLRARIKGRNSAAESAWYPAGLP
eukprot:gnl/MRDRNA2_/MRDRNA2_81418_c0_seq2.p1 gnl/MRDRNA2_/MRDRNA2_81418_c0~~gnl/MRDRNA2_/MRDRNA2_81418_c0_seq2.p1  ORF type:complete len:302 (+),score=37.69 gnl/MRDRNA2_/MRDRNA2_81418_c0_seq2:495-1400(+)